MSENKIICGGCGWRGTTSDLLTTPHPFDTGYDWNLTGCPNCKAVLNGERGISACVEQDCWGEVTCGVTTPDGYKRWCSKHNAAHWETATDGTSKFVWNEEVAVMADEPRIEITNENAESRINDAAETLYSCWNEWQAEADYASQVEQDGSVGDLMMLDFIAVILQGMVFDAEPTPTEGSE